MSDLELRQKERAASRNPEATKQYLITQLRSGLVNPDDIIRCVLNREDPETAERCLPHLLMVLQKDPKKVVTLAIGMANWWDASADNEDHYHAHDGAHNILKDFLNKNPLEVRHILDAFNNWHGEANRISYHQNSYPTQNPAPGIAMNILSELDMFEDYYDFDYDNILYTTTWAWYCAQLVSEAHREYLVSVLWEQLQRRNEFVHENDYDEVQNIGYLALNAIRNHSLRDDFIKRLDHLRAQENIVSLGNGQLEYELNLFADNFQSGTLIGDRPDGNNVPPAGWWAHSTSGLLEWGITRVNDFYTLPQIREMVVQAFK